MGKTILVIGREGLLGEAIAGHFQDQGCQVATAVGNPSPPVSPPGRMSVPWNRASAISSKSVILRVRQEWGPLDAVWIIISPERETQTLTSLNAAEVELLVDRQIKGLLFLIREVFQRQREESVSLHFVFFDDDPSTLPPLASLEYFGLKALVRGLLAEARDRGTDVWAYEAQGSKIEEFVKYILTSKSLQAGVWNVLRDKKGLGWFGKKEAP